MRKGTKWTALLLAVCMMACLAGCSAQSKTAAPELLEPVGVQADKTPVYRGDIYTLDVYTGAVESYVEELTFPEDGTVESVPGYAGKLVEEGEVLIRLDVIAEEKRAQQLRDELEYEEKDNAYADQLAEKEIQMLQVELRELRSYGADSTSISLKQLDIKDKQAQLRQTQELREIALGRKRQELEELEKIIGESTVTAPFAGRVINTPKVAGERVSENDPAAYLVDESRIFVSSEYIPETTLGLAKKIYALIDGQAYELTPQPVDQERYLEQLAEFIDPNTYYDFAETDLPLPEIGAYASVMLVKNYATDVLLVPANALYKDKAKNETYVYVDADGRQERRTVTTGIVTDAQAEITEGLKEGEIVYVQ